MCKMSLLISESTTEFINNNSNTNSESHGLHSFTSKSWRVIENLVLSTACTEMSLCVLPDLKCKQEGRANKIWSGFL